MVKRQCSKLLSNLSFVKLVCVLLMALVLVQILYVLRLNQPNSYQQILERLSWHKQQSRNSTFLVKQSVNKLKTVHIMDWTGMYYIVPNFIRATNQTKEEVINKVTVCVHMTPNHLNNLVDLVGIWNGPISVSVFTHRHNIDSTAKAIINLHLCNNMIRQFVSFHIVFPIRYAKENFVSVHHTIIDCDSTIFNNVKENINYDSKEGPYPSNTLRNVAIENAQTRYILVLDIDVIPSKNLHKQFNHFLQRQNRKSKSLLEKTAFVLPCFESKSMDAKEIDKDTLKLHIKDGSIRPFYVKACEICQIDTDYSRWLEFPSMGFLETAYEVEWAMSWEPFYIADKSHLPLYDSRFKQYGYNRVSQICEAFLKGFRFLVLNNGFLVHRGFKDIDSFHANKSQEHKHNRELFNVFKIEMKDRYPDVSRQC